MSAEIRPAGTDVGLRAGLPAAISNANCTSPERPPSLEDAAASLQKSYDSLTKDPQKIKLAECTGVKIYEDPQPPGHPPSAEECVQVLRQFGFARDKTGKLIELPSADNQKSVQQTDPYADSYQQQATAHFRQELNGLSNTIHNLNFALGCLISPTARGGKLAGALVIRLLMNSAMLHRTMEAYAFAAPVVPWPKKCM